AAVAPLPQGPAALAVAPDARRAYLLALQHRLGRTVTSLLSVDLATAAMPPPVRLPRLAVSVAATGARVLAPRGHGAEAWGGAAGSRRVARPFGVGGEPVGVRVAARR